MLILSQRMVIDAKGQKSHSYIQRVRTMMYLYRYYLLTKD